MGQNQFSPAADTGHLASATRPGWMPLLPSPGTEPPRETVAGAAAALKL